MDEFISCAARKTGYLVIVDWQKTVLLMVAGVMAAILPWSKLRPHKFSLARHESRLRHPPKPRRKA
jgi:hypothetical protein